MLGCWGPYEEGEAPTGVETSLIRVVGEVMRKPEVMFMMKREEGEEGFAGYRVNLPSATCVMKNQSRLQRQ